MIISGIDEAGRGPVLGPMVISIFKIEEEKLNELVLMGVKDSKKLQKVKREKIFLNLKENGFCFNYNIIPPEELDKESLNKIFLENVIFFCKKTHTDLIYLDAPCHKDKCMELSSKLTNLTGKNIIAQNRADEEIPVVSAASIVSKVIRDREIEKLHKIYGDFGSGYPSDKKTIKWLLKNFQIAKEAGILRKKWKLKLRI